jgi:DNA-directed RNA polymerase subunit alpha
VKRSVTQNSGQTPDSSVTILNPDHHIATLSEEGHIQMELYITQGRRYLNWSDEVLDENEFGLGTIRIDAVFNPINKVHVVIDKLTERYENVILTVWTNGGILPGVAVSKAASILAGHCRLFDASASVLLPTAESDDNDIRDGKTPQTLDIPLEHLNLSSRSHGALTAENINILADLVGKSEEELRTFRRLGEKSLEEIKISLAGYNLKLGMDTGD